MNVLEPNFVEEFEDVQSQRSCEPLLKIFISHSITFIRESEISLMLTFIVKKLFNTTLNNSILNVFLCCRNNCIIKPHFGSHFSRLFYITDLLRPARGKSEVLCTFAFSKSNEDSKLKNTPISDEVCFPPILG